VFRTPPPASAPDQQAAQGPGEGRQQEADEGEQQKVATPAGKPLLMPADTRRFLTSYLRLLCDLCEGLTELA